MVYFCTELWLKENLPLSANIQITDVTPWLQTAAQMWIQPILGTFFYNSLLTKYNDETLTSDEETLVSMIKPALAWKAYADCAYSLSYTLKNKGIVKQNGENVEASDLGEVKFAMAHYNQKGDFYLDLIIDYLKTNKTLFPDFTSTLNKNSLIKPNDKDNLGMSIMVI